MMRALILNLLALQGVLTFFGSAAAQKIDLSETLSVTRIADGVFMHTSDNNNGLIVLSEGEALVVSTPATEAETEALIEWIAEDKGAALVGFVADRWHPDAMGGLRAVHRAEVRSYAHDRTRRIARDRALPVPQVGFDRRMEIEVGAKTVVLDFLGESHTSDGIVAWVQDDLVLFGGNGVRNRGGWFGNIGDANLSAWSQTIGRVKERYGAAEHVVPGHGKAGGADLLDYTIELYQPFSEATRPTDAANLVACPSVPGLNVEEAGADAESGGVRDLKGARVFVRDRFKAVRIRSPLVRIDQAENRLTSATGTIDMFETQGDMCRHRVSLSYSDLFVVEVDEAVGLAIVLKKAAPVSPSR